jgi:hypothetical protein
MEIGGIVVLLLREREMGYLGAIAVVPLPRPRVRPATSAPNDEPPP